MDIIPERDVETRFFFGCFIRVIETKLQAYPGHPAMISLQHDLPRAGIRDGFLNRKPTNFLPPLEWNDRSWWGGIIKRPSRYRRNRQRWVPAECQMETRFDGCYVRIIETKF